MWAGRRGRLLLTTIVRVAGAALPAIAVTGGLARFATKWRGATRRRLFGVAGAAAAAMLMIGGASAIARAGCMRSPGAFSPYVRSGGKLTLRVGEVVYAVEAEPEEYLTAGKPSVFPWMALQSSDPRVLSPIRLCTDSVLTESLPERVFAFRARRAGSATVFAPLTSPWRSVKGRPSAYRATIAVR